MEAAHKLLHSARKCDGLGPTKLHYARALVLLGLVDLLLQAVDLRSSKQGEEPAFLFAATE